MPQMMPLSWLSLYMFFSITFMLFTFMNYYTYIPNSSSSEVIAKKIKSMNWKW
uniref:ATP synthase complex subunit 8 n=1 Tax=Lobopterella dimidiatipes TaxID=63739 RepID=A0A2P1H8Q6_9NEOP|nr:ATP synthase F0 subunit 8 [Lobopterella dimidiatipes]